MENVKVNIYSKFLYLKNKLTYKKYIKSHSYNLGLL